jgi:putative ABC transport system permease protein
MRAADILGIAVSALGRQKARTALTLSGVVIGTFLLAVNLSLGRGTQAEILRQLRRGQQLRQVLVWPRSEARESDIPPEELEVKGPMSDAKRARLRQAIIRRWQFRGGQPRPRALLTRERLRALSELPHVESVVPPKQPCRVALGGKSRDTLCLAATADNEPFRDRIVAGSYLPSDSCNTAVVGEYLLYLWGITADDEVERVVGKRLRVECRPGGNAPTALLTLMGFGGKAEMTPEESRAVEKALKRLPAAVDKLGLSAGDAGALRRLFGRLAPETAAPGEPAPAEEFTVAGVFRELTEEELKETTPLGWGVNSLSRNVDVWLPVKTAEELFLRVPANAEDGFPAVVVTVDDEDNVKQVTERIRALELEEFAPQNFIEQVRSNLILTTILIGFLAAAALLVSVLGITNTMVMSVLERTREIGIMKAVGARDSHVQLLFLVEGALLGLMGGTAGVLLAWLASFPGDSVARSLVNASAELHLTGRLFIFPPWLVLGLPLFAGLVTTLAAFYPARRAARVNPITALRHE